MKKKRKILLLEPGYKNKYPPIGLMKIATYHRKLNDDVIFHKGDIKELVLEKILNDTFEKLFEIYSNINWHKISNLIKKYIVTHRNNYLSEIIEYAENEVKDLNGHTALIEIWLKHFSDYYRKKKYVDDFIFDRIYITTLFTFYWKITIKTIQDAKLLVKDINDIKIGGVMATLLADDIESETGIKVYKGLLDKPGIFDDNDLIIDELPLDYSILDEIEYKYPENNAYYGYMTRGCVRKCSFCAVWKIEPKFNPYVSLKDKIEQTKSVYGDQRNLLLLDNNVLASQNFQQIIEEIKDSGFVKGAKYVEPNQLDISIRNLKNGINDKAYIKKSFELLYFLLNKLKGEKQFEIYKLLKEHDLIKLNLNNPANKKNILKIYPDIKDLFEKYRNKAPKQRYVDFNQGLDARLLTEEKMKLLSEIPIRPLRIAFDRLAYKKVYIKAIRLAAKYNIKYLSNYLLYNEKDKPEELYERLRINILLSEELNVSIYSFPMKFHPISGEKYLNRDFLGKHWNRKYIRAIQTILNSTKGKIGVGSSFFYEAFGKDLDEYFKILIMPETYILHRFFFKDLGYTENWWNEFNNLTELQRKKALEIIKSNDFKNIDKFTKSKTIQNFIKKHYLINREDLKNPETEIYKLKMEYDASRKSHTHLQFAKSKPKPKIAKEYDFANAKKNAE